VKSNGRLGARFVSGVIPAKPESSSPLPLAEEESQVRSIWPGEGNTCDHLSCVIPAKAGIQFCVPGKGHKFERLSWQPLLCRDFCSGGMLALWISGA
jgi:hypothetical protein